MGWAACDWGNCGCSGHESLVVCNVGVQLIKHVPGGCHPRVSSVPQACVEGCDLQLSPLELKPDSSDQGVPGLVSQAICCSSIGCDVFFQTREGTCHGGPEGFLAVAEVFHERELSDEVAAGLLVWLDGCVHSRCG